MVSRPISDLQLILVRGRSSFDPFRGNPVVEEHIRSWEMAAGPYIVSLDTYAVPVETKKIQQLDTIVELIRVAAYSRNIVDLLNQSRTALLALPGDPTIPGKPPVPQPYGGSFPIKSVFEDDENL
jgi:hypothetical protein